MNELKLKKIRTCNFCRHYQPGWIGQKLTGGFDLGISVELGEDKIFTNYTEYEDLHVNTRPEYKCYKPKNIKESMLSRRLIKEGIYPIEHTIWRKI